MTKGFSANNRVADSLVKQDEIPRNCSADELSPFQRNSLIAIAGNKDVLHKGIILEMGQKYIHMLLGKIFNECLTEGANEHGALVMRSVFPPQEMPGRPWNFTTHMSLGIARTLHQPIGVYAGCIFR